MRDVAAVVGLVVAGIAAGAVALGLLAIFIGRFLAHSDEARDCLCDVETRRRHQG